MPQHLEAIRAPLAPADNVESVVHRALDRGINYIDIAVIMRLLVPAERWGIDDTLQADYNALPAKASDCLECGDCAERCPFEVDVIAQMRRAVELFEAA